MKNDLLCTVTRKIFYGLFLFSINLISAMQPQTDYFALAERFVNDAAQCCSRMAKVKSTHSDLSLGANYSESKKDFLTALQQLLNAHEAGHKTSMLLAKQVFDILQKIESIRLENRRNRPLSLSPEITKILTEFKKHDNRSSQISWQEFAHESCDSKDYADYARLQKILGKSMDLLMHR